jgi:hypothetical protein
MALNIPLITELPQPPLKSSPSNFAERADTFLDALPTFAEETNSAIVEMNKITSGLDQQTPIAAWAALTTYDFPDVVACTDGFSYRCVANGVTGIDPMTDSGAKWVNLTGGRSGGVPIGTVVAFIGGYFTDGFNGGFTNVLGNTAANINAVVNEDGWYVANGAALNSGDSPIFSGFGRYLPNISDSRFLMGSSSAGAVGGSNTTTHTHSVSIAAFTSGGTALSISQLPSHNHSVSVSISSGGAHSHSLNGGVTMGGSSLGSGGTRGDKSGVAESAGDHSHGASGSAGYTGSGVAHTHAVTAPTTISGAASVSENRPQFLSCFYIMKVM